MNIFIKLIIIIIFHTRCVKRLVDRAKILFLKSYKLIRQRQRRVWMIVWRMLRVAVICDDESNDDVVHVFNLLEADFLDEDY
jgi:DNA-binding transcriptional regulator PaaX